MHFRMRYITADFEFGNAQISVSDPVKQIDVVVRKRPEEDSNPPFEARDGVAIATCQRPIPARHHDDAVASGSLSIKREAVRTVRDEMKALILHTLRLARWRTNSPKSRPNPVRWATEFSWSFDGIEWKPVADNLRFKVEVAIPPQWTNETAEFVRTEALSELDEPLGHELLREASVNRKANPRSSVVLAVAAAEVGFKQFAAKALPDTEWILGLQAPPLFDMLSAFPWAKLGPQFNGGRAPIIPDSIKSDLKKWVVLRNKIVHAGAAGLTAEIVDSVLTSVRDFLYFLDALRGQQWALNHIRRKALKQAA